MKEYKTKNIRNVGFIGHSDSGKTTIIESLLFHTKVTDRFGTVEDENTVSDYDSEERKRKISISTTVQPCEFNNTKINLIDMPGYFDFVGEMIEGLRVSDLAMIVVSGVSGMEVGTEKAWKYVNENEIPKAFFINKLDRENSNFEKVLNQLIEQFGNSVVPIQYPIGKEENFKGIVDIISKKARIFNADTGKMEDGEIPEDLIDEIDRCKEMLMESVAETDEELLEKYFSDDSLTDEEIYDGLIKGISEGEIVPLMCGSALTGVGMQTLLEDIVGCFPSPEHIKPKNAKDLKEDKDIEVNITEDGPFSAFVFKTIADPFVGKLSVFKVMSGKVKSDTVIYNVNKSKEEKIGSMFFLRGKSQIDTKEIVAGDIGAVSKLQYTNTGDTLCESSAPIMFEEIKLPSPSMSMSVMPKSKGDEDKISSGLNKLSEEDLSFKLSRDAENAEIILSGIGETHLEVISSKLKDKFGVEVVLQTPKVPYRETIKKAVEVQGKHKKQSGGHGQYGDVCIKFEPRDDGEDEMLFVDKIVGGVVPRQYIPAVEKGLKECTSKGVLAGFPVIRLKATLFDGSYHTVDSSEMAFKVAASLAYKKGLEKAQSVLLEPIYHVEVLVPDDYMGDVIADINKKRGKILGMEPQKGQQQKVIAEVPQAEMFKYATDLKSITQARGSFEMRFERYEEVPETETKKIIEELGDKEED